MDCHEAGNLIDLRVEMLRRGPQDAPSLLKEGVGDGLTRDWSDLDEHLAGCPKCAADLTEFLHTRRLLADLHDDKPTNEEMQVMWQAIEPAAGGTGAATQSTGGQSAGSSIGASSRVRSILRFAVASVAVAAVLVLAFGLGNWRYGGGPYVGGLFGLSGARPSEGFETVFAGESKQDTTAARMILREQNIVGRRRMMMPPTSESTGRLGKELTFQSGGRIFNPRRRASST